MKKILVALFLVAMMSTPAFALFTNGGFEDGTFNGWTLDYGYRASNDTKVITWGQTNNGLSAVISAGSANQYGQTLDVNPYNGTYMARINDVDGGNHATKISQTDTISQTDINNGSILYVNWGAMLIEPENEHPEGAQPYFHIDVWVGGILTSTFDADALDTAGWTQAGYYDGDLWYKAQTWSYDLSGYALGTEVALDMYVSDCGWGGHGGFAFIDGLGTVDPGDPGKVPEPATMLLLGLGLIGLVGVRRKIKK